MVEGEARGGAGAVEGARVLLTHTLFHALSPTLSHTLSHTLSNTISHSHSRLAV